MKTYILNKIAPYIRIGMGGDVRAVVEEPTGGTGSLRAARWNDKMEAQDGQDAD